MNARHAAEPTRVDRPLQLWGRRALIGAVLIAALAVAYFFLAAALPRWWSERVGSAVDGHLSTGVFLGIVVGLSCTLVPLIFLWIGFHRHSKAGLLAWLVLAVIVAMPNLNTLGIAWGHGNAARIARHTLDIRAPWFRGGTLIGAIAAAVIFACMVAFGYSRRWPTLRRRRTSQPSGPEA